MEHRKYNLYICYSKGLQPHHYAQIRCTVSASCTPLIQTQVHRSWILFSHVLHNDLLKLSPEYQHYICFLSILKQYMFTNIHRSALMSSDTQSIPRSTEAFQNTYPLPSCDQRPQLTIVHTTTESLAKHH